MEDQIVESGKPTDPIALPVVFDGSRKILLKLLSSEGTREVTVRFPSDEEWVEYNRRRKIIIKQLGRGISETVVPDSGEADTALFAKIREGEGPEVDSFEANRILRQLSQADVDDVVSEAGAFRVVLRVPGGLTVHIMRMPSAKEVSDFRRTFARILDLPYGKKELTLNHAAASALYQKLAQGTEGYAGAVPIIHQVAAVSAAIDALDAAFAGDQTGNF